jgi:hypothetical protein
MQHHPPLCKSTRLALIFLHLFSEPLCAIYTLLPFILIKDFKATSVQIALFISLRPLLSFFSFYWGSLWNRTTALLLKNVKYACLLAYTPFLLVSMTNNVWLILLASAFFQLFHRAGTPAWLEIVKRKLPRNTTQQSFSFSFAAGFIVSGIYGLSLGMALDYNIGLFSYFLAFAALLGVSSLFFLRNIATTVTQEPISHTTKPIKESVELLQTEAQFRHFQIIFMIGGATLMLMAPALSMYYVKTLSLSHSDISYARFVFMALGVISSSFFWNRSVKQNHLNQLIGPILAGFSLFPLLLLFTQFDSHLLYLAFFAYGIAQTGSHLVWNLSGITFSGGKSAILYSQVNLLMIGVRGLIFPFLGSFLCSLFNPPFILLLGILFCSLGSWYSIAAMRKKEPSLNL